MIATTIEQSYKLLEAGLSPESADMHYSSRKQEQDANGEWKIVLGDLCVGKCETENDLPAWSYTKLYDILYNTTTHNCFRAIVDDIIDATKKGNIEEKYLKK